PPRSSPTTRGAPRTSSSRWDAVMPAPSFPASAISTGNSPTPPANPSTRCGRSSTKSNDASSPSSPNSRELVAEAGENHRVAVRRREPQRQRFLILGRVVPSLGRLDRFELEDQRLVAVPLTFEHVGAVGQREHLRTATHQRGKRLG